jgi:hypothetical protein
MGYFYLSNKSIYEETYNNNKLHAKSTLSYNRIFETIVKLKHTSEQHAPSDTTPSHNT